MVKERCWKCNKLRNDVELRSCDDRLCEPCFQKNEEDLVAARSRSGGKSSVTTPKSDGAAAAAAGTVHGVTQAKRRGAVAAASPATVPHSGVSTSGKALKAVMSTAQQTASADENLDHSAELTQLRQLVSNQQTEINNLHVQVNFLLSFLGITQTAAEGINGGGSPVPGTHPQTEPQDEHVDRASRSEVGEGALWNQVTRSYHARRSENMPGNTFQQSVVAAVYLDQSIKKRRETSIIVSGLAPNSDVSDAELFTSLCSREFHLVPNVLSTKRLGRSWTDKIQPLLVYLKQADQAQQLIANAKQLRQSSDATTKEKVFLNPNLTRAEAAAAYQARVQRRMAQQRRIEQRSTNAVASNDINRNNCLQDSAQLDSRQQLNPMAESFNLSASNAVASAVVPVD
jgi:hypothetical protein